MSSTLPFIKPPKAPKMRRLGTEASGIIEMPTYGGLTVGESSLITQLLSKEQSSFVAGARIAEAIAKAEDISLTEAFNIIEASVRGTELEPEAESIRIRHANDIEKIAKIYALSGQRNMAATVTALIASRLERPEWSLEDTKGLHRALFTAIWELAAEEQAAEDEEAMPPPDEETLGKPPVASTKLQRPTGGR